MSCSVKGALRVLAAVIVFVSIVSLLLGKGICSYQSDFSGKTICRGDDRGYPVDDWTEYPALIGQIIVLIFSLIILIALVALAALTLAQKIHVVVGKRELNVLIGLAVVSVILGILEFVYAFGGVNVGSDPSPLSVDFLPDVAKESGIRQMVQSWIASAVCYIIGAGVLVCDLVYTKRHLQS